MGAVLKRHKLSIDAIVTLHVHHKIQQLKRVGLKTPRNERICLHCKTDNFSEIDDEQHLLLKCSRFSEIRIALFDHVRKSCPRIDTLNDENKFIYLLISSGSTIKEVAKFLHSAYTARSA